MKQVLKNFGRSVACASITSMAYASTALAAFGGNLPDLNGVPNSTDPRDTITKILNAVLNFLALIAVVVIVIAGIRLIVSQGEEEQKDKAKKTIFYAVIGLIIILFSKVIVSLITNYLAAQI